MMKYSMASYGAQFCEVRVHEETGEVRVSRWLGSFDCGTVVNPKTATSQLRGGIIMGIGMALTEETLFDERRGRIMNPVARRVSCSGESGCSAYRDHLHRHPRRAHAYGRARNRRNRHHGRGGGDRECGFQRHGKAHSGPADHSRQASVTGSSANGGTACVWNPFRPQGVSKLSSRVSYRYYCAFWKSQKSPGIPYRAADLCRFRLLQYSALTGGIHHNEFRGPLDRLAIRTQLRIDPDLEDRG